MKRILFCLVATCLLAACSKDGGTTTNNGTGGGNGNGNGGGGNGGGSSGNNPAALFRPANNFFIYYKGAPKPSSFQTNDFDGNTNLVVVAADDGALKIEFHNMNNPAATQTNADYTVTVDGLKVIATEAEFNAAATDTLGRPHVHIFSPNGASITVAGTQYSQIIVPLIKLQTSSDISNGVIREKGVVLSTGTSFPLSEATAVITNPTIHIM